MYYPFIGGHQKVNVIGSAGRAMLRDARHLAPDPCKKCTNLCLSRDELSAQDILHCSDATSCPALITGKINPSAAEAHFIDEMPIRTPLGEVPIRTPLGEESPCYDCSHRKVHTTPRATIEYCARRREGIEYCVERGDETPEAYIQLKRAKEERELEHELDLIDSVDLTDYGTF